MSIVFDENLDLFCLETANTSYIIGLADHRTFVGHVYYGDRLFGEAVCAICFVPERHRLFHRRMKESAALFMIHFHRSIPETEWEIIGKAALLCAHRLDSMRLCRPMSLMKLQIRNQNFRDCRLLLTGRIPHRH